MQSNFNIYSMNWCLLDKVVFHSHNRHLLVKSRFNIETLPWNAFPKTLEVGLTESLKHLATFS
jgi:hypothetical protein